MSLEKRGQAQNTIVVLAGDNGLAVGRHGLMGKQNQYEHSIRVPMVLRGPGVAEGGVTDSYAYLLDLFPTLCELMELETPPTVEGRSLVPVLRNPRAVVRREIFAAYAEYQRSIKDDRYKLIQSVAGGKRHLQLFDLSQDPDELRDLSDSAAHRERVALLQKQLRTYAREWGDPASPQGAAFWSAWDQAG